MHYNAMITEQWNNEGVLELRTAFSRDQNCKVYVQDLIIEDAKHIWNLLQVIIIQSMFVPMYNVEVTYNENSVGLSSTTNPKPKG